MSNSTFNRNTKNPLSTDELLKRLHRTRSVSELSRYTASLPENNGFSSFSDYLCTYIQERNISESELIKNSLIQRTYAYQILNGTKNPGRDKVLALCLAAHMNYDESQRALTLAGLGKLYPRRKKDSILIFALEHQLSVQQTNELLFEEQETPLE